MNVAERLRETFRRKPMSATEETVVRALLDHLGSTSGALAEASGYRAGNGWHPHFGMMCEARAADLWPAPPSKARDAAFHTGILADYDPVGSTFAMKPEVVEGFAAMGLHAARPA